MIVDELVDAGRRKPGGVSKRKDWPEIRADFEAGKISVRAIGRKYGISNVAIHNKADRERWSHPGRPEIGRGSVQIPVKPPFLPKREVLVSSSLAEAANSTPQELVERGRDVAERLLDELNACTSNFGEIEDLIRAETADDADGQRRRAMLRAVGLPTRAGVLRNLALAVKTLGETVAGKKEERVGAAKKAASGRFETPEAPKLVVNNR